jgi:hypothetical protein
VATIIDALVVTLGLDSGGFKKGADQASTAQKKIKDDISRLEEQIAVIRRKSIKETKVQDDAQIKSLREVLNAKKKVLTENSTAEKEQIKRQKEQTQGLNELKGAAFELLAVFTAGAGIKAFVQDLVFGDAAMGRFATNFGVSAQYVSALGAAIASVSGNAQEAQSTIAKLAATAFGLKTGRVDPTQLAALSRVGISRTDLNDPSEALRKAAKRAETMPKQQFFQYALAAGIDPGTATALEGGLKSWDALIAKYTAAQALTDAQIAKNQALVSSLADLKAAISGVGRDFLGMMPPQVTDAVKWLSTTGLPAVTGAMVGLGIAAAGLTIALALPFAPIIAAVAAITALGAAVGWLIADSKKGKDSFLDWVAIGNFFRPIQDALGQVGDALKYVIGLLPPMKVNWDNIKTILGSVAAVAKDALVSALHLVAFEIKLVGDYIKYVVDLLSGRWGAAWKDAGSVLKDTVGGWLGWLNDVSDAIQDVWYSLTHHGQQRPHAGDTAAFAGPGGNAAPGASAGPGGNAGPAAMAAAMGAAAPGASAGPGNGSLADRNNNPGNLTDGRGHFLKFPTKEAGFAAMRRQLLIDYGRGQNNVTSLINDPRHGWSNQWAPGNSAASTSGYIARVSRALGVSRTQALNLSDPAVLNRLIIAMNAVERGSRHGSAGSIDPGLTSGAGAALAANSNDNSRTSSVSSEVHIGTITVTSPPGADPKATGNAVAAAVRNQSFVAQANTGLA